MPGGKTLHFVKIVALVGGIFPEFCVKSQPLFFIGQATKKRVLPGGKNVTFCQICRSVTGGFY